jgi:CPA1 family monovalent cation:H+ antiporter
MFQRNNYMPKEDPTAAWKHIQKKNCPHISDNKNAKSKKTECEKCDEKQHLRICLACGYVACCESHKSHNTEHFRKTGHAIIKPHRCNYDWLWCYKCNAFLE